MITDFSLNTVVKQFINDVIFCSGVLAIASYYYF